jgi:hypothetical protein
MVSSEALTLVVRCCIVVPFESGMEVFPHDTRANECSELGGRAALRVVPGTLQDRGAFTRDRVYPNLADLYRGAIRRAVWVGVPHGTESRTVDIWSANWSNGASLLELLPHSPSYDSRVQHFLASV